MSNNLESGNIDQLMAEADELVQQINSDIINDMKEVHRLQFEKHAQNLKKIKFEIQSRIENKTSSYAEGMHEAIQDVVTAVQDLKKYLS